jgi:hypothetical protein
MGDRNTLGPELLTTLLSGFVIVLGAVGPASADEPFSASNSGVLLRTQRVDISLRATKDPMVVRREIWETVAQECASPSGGTKRLSKDMDGPRAGRDALGSVQTFPEVGVRSEWSFGVEEQYGNVSYSIIRSDSQEIGSIAPWRTADGPIPDVLSWSLTRTSVQGKCPQDWAIGDSRLVSQRKLRAMPPPEFPDGPIDKLKR